MQWLTGDRKGAINGAIIRVSEWTEPLGLLTVARFPSTSLRWGKCLVPSLNHMISITLPKTNIAHENPPFWWYLPGKMGFSWAMLVSGRVKLKNSLIADSSSIYIITPSWVPQYFTSSSRRGVDVCIFAGNRFFEFPDGNWTQKFSC